MKIALSIVFILCLILAQGCADKETNRAVILLKDVEIVMDDNYTEVTITSREYWDKARIPERVLELEKKGYTCMPYPDEFEYPEQEGNVLAQPVVKRVRWICELPYKD